MAEEQSMTEKLVLGGFGWSIEMERQNSISGSEQQTLIALRGFAVDHLIINEDKSREELSELDAWELFCLVYESTKADRDGCWNGNFDIILQHGHAIGVYGIASQLGWINRDLSLTEEAQSRMDATKKVRGNV